MIQITKDEKANLRLILSGVAMHGLLSSKSHYNNGRSEVATASVEYADELIKALGIEDKKEK